MRAIEALEYIRDNARSTSPELLSKYAEDGIAALLRSMDGQEPAAWIERATFSNGEVRDIIAATQEGARQLATERWRSALFGPKRESIPLYLHPSPQTGEPRERTYTESEVAVMIRDTMSAALKNRLPSDRTSIRMEAEAHAVEQYGMNLYNT